MTTYYVGKGGDNGNAGTSWALRKLTIQAGENLMTTPGDTLIIGPGTYREQITLANPGTSGNPMTWIGDVTGEQTDGIGGLVRITGSNDDDTITRSYCVFSSGTNGDYRTFRGLKFDIGSQHLMYLDDGNNSIVEDCVFEYTTVSRAGIYLVDIDNAPFTIRRCMFFNCHTAIQVNSAGTTGPTSASIVENCLFMGPGNNGPNTISIYIGAYCHRGWKIKNNTFYGVDSGVFSGDNQTGWVDVKLTNCVFLSVTTDCISFYSGQFVIDSCTDNGGDGTDYTGTFDKVNFYPDWPMLRDDGHPIGPWHPGAPSILTSIATHDCSASDPPTEDIFGIARVGNAADMVRGCYSRPSSSYWSAQGTTNPQTGVYTLEFNGPTWEQFIWPVFGSEIVVSVWCWRETGHTGTNPKMIIRQPGQSDITVTDTGSENQWNKLTYTLTPSATPPYIVLQFVNSTTNNSTVRFDNLRVQ